MIASSWLKQSIITVLCVLGIPSYLSAPKPISVHLDGQSSITVPANRAIVSLRVYAEGPRQDKVADEVRKTTDDVLATLRPLAQLQAPQLPTVNVTAASGDVEYEPPIVDLSVTTFRSYSWQKPGSLLSREAPQYQASVEIEAEFRDFDALGILLAQVSKTPAASVQSMKWTLDDATKKRLFSQCRSEAMVDALDKVRAYVRPLGMDKVRAIKLTESHRRSRPVVWGDVDGLRFQRETAHDLLSDHHASYHKAQMEEPEMAETFGLEPGTLEIAAQIEGEFCAWKTGLEAWFRRGGV